MPQSGKGADERAPQERMPKERPERGPDPETLEGSGDTLSDKGDDEARNKVTRKGEG